MPRQKANIHYLYKTTCLITGRYYIGIHSTCNLEDGYMGSGKRLRYSLRKHGKSNHKREILEFFDSRELLIEAEKLAISADMVTDTNCMNLMSGGTGGYICLTVEQKERHRNACINWLTEKWKDEKYATDRTNESRARFKQKKYKDLFTYDWTGKQHSEETKKLMSDKAKAKTPEQNSQNGTCWITRNGENKKIKVEDFDSYVSDDWIKGRKI